jgi:UDP-N-acetylmuramate: L-alanyl-gamma-D-glutamyl-meso-diaminopimelate ligase
VDIVGQGYNRRLLQEELSTWINVYIERLVEMGCWTPRESYSLQEGAGWRAEFVDASERRVRMSDPGGRSAESRWHIGGSHNLENALAAVAAARSAGLDLERAVDALSRFEGVRRRMERTATVGDIAIYDDFAHHPTAIRRTIAAMKRRYPGNRLVVAIEPRSNTMKLGVHNRELADSLERADLVWMYRPEEMSGDFDAALEPLGKKLRMFRDYDELASDMSTRVLAGDQVVFMSNGGFSGARQTLTAVLQRTRTS